MITDEQRKERINYLGATDASAVLGMSRWSTPLSVWAEKIGLVPPKDLSRNRAVIRGTKLEPYVSDLFEEETGKKLAVVPDTAYHPKYKFLAANLDRILPAEDAIVELKTANWRQKKEWADGQAPREHIIQVMHQLAVTGKPRAYLACLILGDDDPLTIRTIERDEAAIANLVKREIEFWRGFVETKIMPATVMSGDKETLDAMFPEAEDEKAIQLGDDAAKLIEALGAYTADALHLEDEINKLQNTLRALLGTAECGETATHRVYWTNTRARRFDRDAFCAKHGDLYELFRKESVVRKFLIKEKREAFSGKPS